MQFYYYVIAMILLCIWINIVFKDTKFFITFGSKLGDYVELLFQLCGTPLSATWNSIFSYVELLFQWGGAIRPSILL